MIQSSYKSFTTSQVVTLDTVLQDDALCQQTTASQLLELYDKEPAEYQKALQVLRRLATAIPIVNALDPLIIEQEITKKRCDTYLRSVNDPWFADPRMQRLLSTIETNFDSYDVRSTVLLMYSLARLRLPAVSLLNRLAKSVELNYKDLEVKDMALLFWSFARIRSQSARLSEVLRSRLDSHLCRVIDDENGIYYLEEENSILSEIERNIVE